MPELAIRFSVSPWLLLLLIPALAVPLILHFRLKKNYRRTRNRIVALVLHCIAITLAIFALSGIYFSWEVPNERNELVILVDSSFSAGKAKDRADKFVRELLDANDGRCKTSIVTFGYGQTVALEPGIYGADEAFETYRNAPAPDDVTATDICAALEFCWDPVNDVSGADVPVITHPESARIVLISDGIETDQKAQSVVRRIMMDGIRIDTTFFGNERIPDMWIAGVEYPDKSFKVGDTVNFQIEVKSSLTGTARLTFSDKKGETVITEDIPETSIPIGSTVINFNYEFSSAGHHEVKFSLAGEDDSMTKNNVYYTYFDLDEDCRILVIEQYGNEADGIGQLLEERERTGQVSLEVMCVTSDTDKNRIPQTTDQMQEYDEIILVNIAYRDFEKPFWENLRSYVEDYGGGLFTVGGLERDADGNPVYTEDSGGVIHAKPHAYDKEDIQGTIYQDMLPVNVIDYRPPVGLMIIIDCSGSMVEQEDENGTLVDKAVRGALSCVDRLSPRDYVGVSIVGDTYETPLTMTPMSKKSQITKAIKDVSNMYGGNTALAPTLLEACRQFRGLPKDVLRKHILLITDGAAGDYTRDYYDYVFRWNEDLHVTMTMAILDTNCASNLRDLANKLETEVHYFPNSLGDLPDLFWQDLDFDKELSGAIKEQYNIKVKSHTDTLNGIENDQLEAIELGGYFTTALKGYNDVENPLLANYVPLYAQWRYGKGRVGSYMCDLGGPWGNNLLESPAGKQFVENVIFGLMPTVDISVNTLSAKMIEDNYRTQVSIYNFDGEEEPDKKLVAYVEQPGGAGGAMVRFDLSELSPGGNRFTFENKAEGVYTVTIIKVPKSFNPFAQDILAARRAGGAILKTYRSFSYSKEYLTESDTYTNGKELMIALSSRNDVEGEDKFVYDADIIMDNFQLLVKDFDPRIYLSAAALILLLLGVAVRKFKFKWPHEVIRPKRNPDAQAEK